MLNELDTFETLNGRRFEYVGMLNPNVLRVWEHIQSRVGDEGWHTMVLGGLDVRSINQETLKKLEIWDKLDVKVQEEIVAGLTKQTQAVHELMEKARRGRKDKYPNVPRELICTKCNSKVTIQPSVLVKRVEKIAERKGIIYTVDQYIKTYECTTCRPVKRGKPVNPEFVGLPKRMKCTRCNHEVASNLCQLKKKAIKNNTTIQKLIDGYVCQRCEPTPKRKRKTETEKADSVKNSIVRKEQKRVAKINRTAEEKQRRQRVEQENILKRKSGKSNRK